MKCPKCNGKGEFFNEVYNDGKRRREILIKCNKCNGTGEVPMTNEDWFTSLSTEEKAEWLIEFAIRLIPCELIVVSKKIKTYKNNILEWLKEAHNG